MLCCFVLFDFAMTRQMNRPQSPKSSRFSPAGKISALPASVPLSLFLSIYLSLYHRSKALLYVLFLFSGSHATKLHVYKRSPTSPVQRSVKQLSKKMSKQETVAELKRLLPKTDEKQDLSEVNCAPQWALYASNVRYCNYGALRVCLRHSLFSFSPSWR